MKTSLSRPGTRGIAAIAFLATLATATAVARGDSAYAVDRNETRIANNYDLARVTHGHTSSGKLAHTVSVYGRYVPNLSNSSEFPSLTIDPGRVGGSVYTVQHYSDGSSDVTQGFTVTGNAKYAKVDADTLKITFSKGAIGNPAKYNWRVEYYAANPDDFSPNSGFWLHRL